ncbi:HyaD/HybD family hydrogenase maturation endopeptidase [Martelella alba]|uniref:HyaD/HybD family hydrogenase maturation endopeptidase n=1 Tax=Martelella alba TaxID=2590451 RepID=A0ABY2SL69_9HYPH|nr:HyaD/HybD family hydrogenase maturation endopeptidase [Martelella alba]TKI06481.1 HyaD/HybD family hydrogenase maturation endopeptidase [Martelella alba]
MKIRVLGIGNLLMSDEAAGVRIVERLRRYHAFSPAVDLLDGGTSGMELLEDISGCDHLIVADAILTGHAPGTLTVLCDEAVPVLFARKISPHQLGLSDVLMALRLMEEFPRRLTLVGVEPETLIPGIGMSAAVRRAVAPATEVIVKALRLDGIGVSARRDTAMTAQERIWMECCRAGENHE